ncbi:phytanoyl-CoA hydroxylase [Diaporthe helianthi]|uniref:Phytanoyl-CoA hydroxylase n=1 Tax=Diaporthe helianthi TaxID=158607 RepID=A0A2P5I9A0_DIAHE|nr:phytanoyl-CoA hydroxylase [Diaporthe helianthi]
MPHAEPPTPPSLDGVNLHVNDGLFSPSEVAQMRVSRADQPLDVLRERYQADGYVFLKGLLARDDVLKAREAYFAGLAHTGVLKPGTTNVEGIFDSAKPATDYPGIGAGQDALEMSPVAAAFVDGALAQHTAWWYWNEEGRGFAQNPALREFVERFTGWGDKALPVKRTLLRNNTPGNRAIGVHYDQSFLRYGEPTALTAWVPMGDISMEGGGLIYLEDGVKLGEEIENEFSRKAKEAGMSDEEMRNAFNSNMMSTGFLCDGPLEFGRKHGRRWLATAYEAGDVVLHQSHAIHASTINHDARGRIRVGTDLRFVDSSRPWDTRWDKHYEMGDGV